MTFVNLLNSGRYDIRLNTCAFTVSSLGQTVLKKEYDQLKLDHVHFRTGIYSENNSAKDDQDQDQDIIIHLHTSLGRMSLSSITSQDHFDRIIKNLMMMMMMTVPSV
jgi:hypothetical protein